MTMLTTIREFLTTQTDAMSRVLRITRRKLTTIVMRPTHDWSRPDYQFWRRAYYCREKGLELSGLFIKPLCNKIATWTIGESPEWLTDSESATGALNEWWDDHLDDIMEAYVASLIQGDEWLVVNPDLSITILLPETVDPIVDDSDFSRIIGWSIQQRYQHPVQPAADMRVTDNYTAQAREKIVEINGVEQSRQTFSNPIGRLPIVHIPNKPFPSQTFGHAEAEALVELFHRYGLILDSAIEGNQLQGRATPVITFETQKDLDRFVSDYGTTKTNTLPDGTTEQYISFDIDLTQVLAMSRGQFSYEAPSNFTEDTERLAQLLYYLFLEHTELPEFVLGSAIASSQASAETQMPIFEGFINGRRRDNSGWLQEVASIVLAYQSILQPGIAADVNPKIQYKQLTQNGQLTQEAVSWAFSEGLLDEKTALALAPIEVTSIDDVLAKAREEREERQRQAADMFGQQRQLDEEIDTLEDEGEEDGTD